MTNPGGSAVQPPLFTDEGPQYAQAAFAHNRPFAVAPPYRTPLSASEEQTFRLWLAHNRSHEALAEYDPNSQTSDYDMRGWWKENGGPQANPGAFFNDKWKTPYDTTFSRESAYATADNPFAWKDGATLIDTRDGSVVFFNPSHYASEPGSEGMDTPSFAPPDIGRRRGGPAMRGRPKPPESGSRWQLGIQHPDGTVTAVPISGSGTNRSANVQAGPGDRIVVRY